LSMESKVRGDDAQSFGPVLWKGRARVAAILLIVFAAILVYSNTLKSPFVLDDPFVIVNSPYVHALSNFRHPGGPRYVGYLTFALNYSLGGLNLPGYHLVNIAIHILNGILVYTLVQYIFMTPLVRNFTGAQEKSTVPYIALLSALIFTVHPVNTEAVTYIVQRFTSLATLFYLLTIVLYLKWKSRRGTGRAARFYVLSLLCAIAAQKTKEISFTLPFMLVFFDFAYFPCSGKGELKKRALYLAPFLFTLIIIPLSLFWTAIAGMIFHSGGGSGGLFTAIPPDLKEIPFYDYVITQLRVTITYFRLLAFPVGQNLDYEYPILQTFLAPEVLLSLLANIVILSSGIYLFLRSRAKKNPFLLIISSGIFWFYLALAVEFFIPLRDVINEHRLYLPGIGIFFAFSTAILYGFFQLRERFALKISFARAAVVISCIIVIPLAAATYARNMVWRDIIVLYEDVLQKSPGKARAHNNLGVEYAKRKFFEKAIKEFRATLKLDPSLYPTIKNIANALAEKGLVDEAVAEYQRFLETSPDDIDARERLAGIYLDKGYMKLAVREYMIMLANHPESIKAHNNLANIFFLQGWFDKAMREYSIVLSMDPGHVETLYNMALTLEQKGDMVGAVLYYRRFIDAATSEYAAEKETSANKVRAFMLENK